MSSGERNHPTGNVEDAHVNDYAFNVQYNAFNAMGTAEEPGGQGVVGDPRRYGAGPSAYERVQELARQEQEETRKRKAEEEQEGGQQPRDDAWAEPAELAPKPLRNHSMLDEKQMDYVRWWQNRYHAKRSKAKRLENEAEESEGKELGAPDDKEATSVFHGKELYNYQGRSWIEPPKDQRKRSTSKCFVPNTTIHTYPGHDKGTSAIRFFPEYGNLLLSSGFDSHIRIWDVHGSGACMRTYSGHANSVRDIDFSHDGRRFASAGYDRKVRLWDTETGKVVGSFECEAIPRVVRVHPDPDKENVVMAGLQNAKTVQWDVTSGDKMQEYGWHTQAINSITFIDENRRFVTTSDDRTMRVWEYGIPVQIKYIADPSMHAMPTVTVHPNGKWMAAQSLDNRLVVYSTHEKYKFNAKKIFRGHVNGGFPIRLSFSWDGSYLASGDSNGSIFFWSWSSTKVVRRVKGHSSVVIGCEWHPLHESRVATCSWDGSIKLWE